MHETMLDYLRSLEREGRTTTVPAYSWGLKNYYDWTTRLMIDPLKATAADVETFQRFLADEYRKPDGKPLAKGTQGTRLSALKGYYAFLYKRSVIVFDPARKIQIPKVRRAKVACDYLNQQEATALIQTQARIVAERKEGSRYWALESRNLAMLALAIATGRRRTSMFSLRVRDLDFERNEVRIEWEKGKAGRVLPCVKWAVDLARDYIKKARPILLGGETDPDWLFIGQRTERVCGKYLGRLLRHVQQRTVEENPDLEELAAKKLKTHSLRVTFAMMMFLNGAGIRIINELLLHTNLSTTAKYTPLELDDLRRACRLAHPRA